MSLSAAAFGTAGQRRWTPLELGTALTVWYDASDASTVTLTDSKVSQLNDKSGNARDATQDTAGNRPVVASATQNGLDALRFYEDGTADWLSVPSTGVSSQPYALIAVLKYGEVAADEVAFMNSAFPALYRSNSAGGRHALWAGNALTGGVTSGWDVVCAVANGASSSVTVNGTVTTGSNGNQVISGATTRLGGRSDGTTTPMRGWIGEFLIHNGSISTANRQLLEGYLAHKWGLASLLTSGHPHKDIRP